MITLADYYMGRDITHGHLLGHDLRENAARTVEIVNTLLVIAKVAGVTLEESPRTGSIVVSGWRPPDVNASTPGAAPRSLHVRCQALDAYDPDGDLDDWLSSPDGQRVMADLGLWHEDPAFTKTWAHVQTKPPKSGRRTFRP